MKPISTISSIALLGLCVLLFAVSTVSPWALISEFTTELVSLTEEEGDCAFPEWQTNDDALPKAPITTVCEAQRQGHGSVRFGWLLLPDYPPEKS